MENRGNRDNAEGSWKRLSDADQRTAARVTPKAVSAFTRRKGRFPALVRFLRDRQFEDFDCGLDIDIDGQFIVKPGNPEWRAWLGWTRRKFGDKGVEYVVKLGYLVADERWPEGQKPATVE